MRIWNRGSGQERKRIAHEGPVTAVSYSLGGRYLATASGHGARLLDGKLLVVALGCGHVSQNLSADEWSEHLPDEPYRRTCPDLPGGP